MQVIWTKNWIKIEVKSHLINFYLQITLFGESAGAQSVLFHLMSTESAPYFHRAILQSFIAYPYQNKQEMSTVAGLMQTQFKLRFKCGLALSALECLR